MWRWTAFWLLLLPMGMLRAQPVVGNVTAVVTSNVLRYDVTFTTTQAARGFVEYRHVDGNDTIVETTGYSDSATSHAILLMGLVPQVSYEYRAVAFDAGGCYPGAWESLVVGAVPQGVTVGHVAQLQTVAGLARGFLLSNTAHGDPDRYLQVHDRRGRLIWYERMPGVASALVDGPCQFFHYDRLTNTILTGDCGEVRQMALDGSTVRSHNVASLAPGWMPHHDAELQPDGRLLLLVAKLDTIDKSSVGGDPNALVVGPGVLEVNGNGVVDWSWSAFDHLDPLQSPGPGGDWAPKFGAGAINWLDANSVMMDGDDNPMLCLGGTSQVLKLARSGGNVVWTVGPQGSIDILPPDSMVIPHSLRRLPNGHYINLDNQGLGNRSRVVEWRIDFNYITPLMERLNTLTLPVADYSAEDGNVDALPDGGGYVVGSYTGHSINQYTTGGGLIWRAQLDSALHRAYWLEDFYARVHPRYVGDTIVCLLDSMVRLEASIPGGVWSGDYVAGDSFDVVAAGPGPHLVRYKWGPESFELYLQVDPAANCGVGVGSAIAEVRDLVLWPHPVVDGNAWLGWEQAQADGIMLEVHHLTGQRLAWQDLGMQSAGRHVVVLGELLDGLAAGNYLLTLRNSRGVSAHRILQCR